MRTLHNLRRPAAFITVLVVAAGAVAVMSMLTPAKGPSPASEGPSAVAAVVAKKPGCIPPEGGTGCLPTAPEADRVDLDEPSFSDPTHITNPLFPTGAVPQVVMLGTVGGEPFRTEVTLLRETRTITWNGEEIETLVSQYTAYLGGRIHEVALDLYGQADDGSVWYFGEDVFNYQDGVVADTHGTWIAGKDGPPGMIMPANPRVGDVYRSENIPGLVFEEVTVKSTGVTVDGPHGPVEGAIIVQELHADGVFEDKTFSPGYGEFSTGGAGGDLEALALAIPTDSLNEPVPAELDTLLNGAAAVYESAGSADWPAVEAGLADMSVAWKAYQTGDLSPMLYAQMSAALDSREAAVDAQEAEETRRTALDVAQASLDFRLRYQPGAGVDLGRFDLWAARLLVDAKAGDHAAVLGDVTVLEWTRDRVVHALRSCGINGVDETLAKMRAAADHEDLAGAAEAAEHLRDLLAAPRPEGCAEFQDGHLDLIS